MATFTILAAIGVALVVGAIAVGTYLNARRAQSTNRLHAAWRRHRNPGQARRRPSELM
jgi:hypothetical protein